MEISGVPDSIEWQPVADFLTSLGLDLKRISASQGEDSGVVIGRKSIRCTVVALNADGNRYVDTMTGKAAVHHVMIPIVDSETDR